MARSSSPRRPAPRSGGRPARLASAVVLLCGAIATLVGQAAVMLNEPTQLPDVAATLVVQTAAQVTGERTLAVGLVLLALGVGFHLGGGLRPARRPTRTPARAKAVSRTTTRTRTPDRRGANK